jgi:hypothetical protein
VNRRTWAFHEMFASLPAQYQQAANDAFQRFLLNPNHPALRSHPLKPTRKGQHWPDSISVTISMGYRAIYVVRNGVNVWYWIGSHADYDKLIGRK